MKKALMYITAAVFLIALLPACRPSPSSYFFVMAMVTYSGGSATGYVSLTDTRKIEPITYSRVTVNGEELPYDASSGYYTSSTLTRVIPGEAVELKIKSAPAYVCVSATMPASSGQVTIPLEGCVVFSSLIPETM